MSAQPKFVLWRFSFDCVSFCDFDLILNLSYREIANYVGATYQGKMCDADYGGGVALVQYVFVCLIKMCK